MPKAAKQQALSLLSIKEYANFGPTLASKYLGKKCGLWIGKETVRKWMNEVGLWKIHPTKIEKVHQPPSPSSSEEAECFARAKNLNAQLRVGKSGTPIGHP